MIVAIVAVLSAAVVVAPAVAQKQDGFGCPPSFEMYTPAEAVSLPRTQLAITDGFVSKADALAAYDALDANGSGYVCVALPYGFEVTNRPGGQYYYNAVDDNASVPS